MMLSELELAVLSVYLDKLVWNDRTARDVLYMAAFEAKEAMNEPEELETFHAFLSEKISRFDCAYQRWSQATRLSVSDHELNQKFQQLTEPVTRASDEKVINYNSYVDEILDSASPPHSESSSGFADSEEDEDTLAALVLAELCRDTSRPKARKASPILSAAVKDYARSFVYVSTLTT